MIVLRDKRSSMLVTVGFPEGELKNEAIDQKLVEGERLQRSLSLLRISVVTKDFLSTISEGIRKTIMRKTRRSIRQDKFTTHPLKKK